MSHLAWNLSVLGYPDQAMTHIREALTRSRELGHPYSRMYALLHAIHVHELRREVQAIQECAETPLLLERQKPGFSRPMLSFSSGIPVSPVIGCLINCCLPLPGGA